MAKRVIKSLQVFRGVAALAVVAHHTSLGTEAFVTKIPGVFQSIFHLGYLGVDFFFVLSGFIIMYSHMEDARTVANVRRYALKRLVRIFPAYLPISIALILLYWSLPGFSASGGREFSLLGSLFLLPADLPPALPVAWTMVHEVLFYSIFLLFFISMRLFVVGILLWGGVIVMTNFFNLPTGWARYPLSLLNIEFMFGVLSAWVVRASISRINSRILIVVGTVLAFGTLFLLADENATYIRVIFALGLAVIIIGFAKLERDVVLPWPATLLLLGNASYSIYLIHTPLLSISQRLAGKFEFHWLVAMVFGVTVSVIAGLIYYRLVERRAIAYFRNRLSRS